MSLRELSKFLAGVATWECVIHIGLRYMNLLPIHIWGIIWTEQYNMIQIIVSGALALFFIWYGWFKK